MTIQAAPSEQSYAADGVSTVFVIPFPFDTSADLKLTSTDASGNIVTLSTGFTISGGAGSTGNATFTVAPAAGITITIYDNPALTQPTDYVSLDAFPAESHERALDRVTRIAKRLYQLLQRSIRYPDGDVSTDGTLGSIAIRKGKYLFFNVVTGAMEYAANIVTTALSQSIIGQLLTPQTAAETNTGITANPAYPYGNMLRYGLVADSVGAATANTAALKTLFNPSIANGPTGQFYFPNASGTAVYYINDMIPIRDGVSIDLQKCTLNFAKTYAAADNLKGWLMFIRDVTIENGSIVVNYNGTAGAGQNPGPIMRIGSRQGYAFAGYTGGIFDQEDLIGMGLPPMGNIVLRNLRMTTNNPNAACSFMVNLYGGLRNVLVENIVLTGNGAAGPECGFYYEFGYATRNGFPAVSQRWSSSHATNMVFRNITGTNLNTTSPSDPYVVALVEAYGAVVENIHSDTCCGTFEFRIGEAHFFRPWTADATGAKRGIIARNITSQGATLIGCYLNAAQATTAGYLSDANMTAAGLPVLTPTQKVDLMHFSLDGFALDGASAGVKCSGPVIMKNGTATGGANPIFLDGDCSVFNLQNVEALGGSGVGMRISDPSTLFARNRRGVIRTCKVAGNTGPGISLANVGSVKIENCQLGYNTLFDAANETTQTDGVSVDGTGTNAGGVYCTGNFVTVSGAGVGYRLVSGTTTICCGIEQARGVITTTGNWDIDGVASTSAATIADKTSFINNFNGAAGVTNKYFLRRCYDTSNTRLMVAQGTGATSNWVRADGGATVTPA